MNLKHSTTPPEIRGFSLLEVVITVALLMTITMTVASTLRHGFDVKRELAQRAKVIHRLQVVMSRIAKDLQHAYIVSTKDQVRNGLDRNMKTIFKIDEKGEADELMMTTMTHQPLISGASEGDATFVVYEVREAPDAPGRTHLYRAETKVIPEDFREQPPMRLLAKHIKSLKVVPWKGDSWGKDGWDSGRGEWRNKMPHMVKVSVEGWAEDREEDDGKDEESADKVTEKVMSVIYLPYAFQFKELKSQNSSVRWEKF